MKNLVLPFLMLLFTFGSLTTVHADEIAGFKAPVGAIVDAEVAEQFANMSIEEFLAMTPKDVRAITGERMSFQQTIALKAAQRKIKKEAELGNVNQKSQVVALILVLAVGYLGIHRFYLGYTVIGIIQLLTAGMCGIWTLIDLIRIITGDLGPADGSRYNPTL